MSKLLESTLNPADAVLDQTCLAGDPWMATVRAGQTLRILDLEGNQAVDTLFYSATDATEPRSCALAKAIAGWGSPSRATKLMGGCWSTSRRSTCCRALAALALTALPLGPEP